MLIFSWRVSHKDEDHKVFFFAGNPVRHNKLNLTIAAPKEENSLRIKPEYS
jgi:hypothetical protein